MISNRSALCALIIAAISGMGTTRCMDKVLNTGINVGVDIAGTVMEKIGQVPDACREKLTQIVKKNICVRKGQENAVNKLNAVIGSVCSLLPYSWAKACCLGFISNAPHMESMRQAIKKNDLENFISCVITFFEKRGTSAAQVALEFEKDSYGKTILSYTQEYKRTGMENYLRKQGIRW